MPENLTVKAPPSQICPMEGGKHKGIITDADKGVTVPSTPYYRRMLREGSLFLALPPAKARKGGAE